MNDKNGKLNASDPALDTVVQRATERDVPPEVEARLRGQLATFRERVETRRWYGPVLVRSLTHRLAFAAAVLVLAGLAAVVLFSGGGSPTWAQVAEQFATVPFFSATIYVKPCAIDEPVQLELWMGRNAKLRMRAGNQMVFGQNGHVLETVEFAPPSASARALQQAQLMVSEVVEKMGDATTFGLDKLVKALSTADTLSAPLPNLHASVSRDLVAFDLTQQGQPDWVRIWALRAGRLPVRFLYWNPVSGTSVDVALSYGAAQPDEFFDPEVFRQAVAACEGDPVTQAYALFKDPGGRPVTPQDVAAQRVQPAAAPVS